MTKEEEERIGRVLRKLWGLFADGYLSLADYRVAEEQFNIAYKAQGGSEE